MSNPVSPERQMARLEIFARLKGAIEKTVEKYRDSDLTTGQFTIQIFLAMDDAHVAFYLDDDHE